MEISTKRSPEIPEIPENLQRAALVFLNTGLKKLRLSKEEVSFECPHCGKVVKIKI